MEKPITIKIHDFKENLVALINKSELPLFIIEPILKNISYDIERQELIQFYEDKERFTKEHSEIE